MVRTILEYLYFLSGPIIAILAAIGLKQISLTKNIAKMNSQRESYRLTADLCRIYASEVIPLINKLDCAIDEKDFQLLTKSKIVVGKDSIKVIPFTKYDHHEKTVAEIAPEISAVYNALNAFSLYFISRVADERIAYATMGKTYCDTVMILAPIIAIWAEETGEDNIFSLFILWHHRKEHEKARIEFEKVKAKIIENQDITIKPIGT